MRRELFAEGPKSAAYDETRLASYSGFGAVDGALTPLEIAIANSRSQNSSYNI